MQRAPHLCQCGLIIAHGQQCPNCSRRQRLDARPAAAARGYDAEWRRRTSGFLAAHPVCEPCASRGVDKASEVVGHIVSVRSDPARRLDPTNWRPLCRSCNAREAHQDKAKGRGGVEAFSHAHQTTVASLLRKNGRFSSPSGDNSERWPWD